MDEFPDCFHGSTTGNIHFHCTHTNPGTTGDNIFIEVRPSLRDAKGSPVVTQASIKTPFDEFFANCEANLSKDVLSQWPHTWNDFPREWVATQTDLLKKYDADPVIVRKLWPADQAQINVGAWPQYYVGATPYCFRLPAYTPPTHNAGHSMDGMRDLLMGQSPGTHWYHAHKHGSTTIDVANGMAGAFIIEGDYDDALSKFYQPAPPPGAPLWTRTQPVLVVNQLGVSPNLFGGGAGGPLPFSVNGRFQPTMQMQPGQVQLWRIVNASSRGGVFLSGFQRADGKPSDTTQSFAWKQTAQDGVQLNGDNYDRSQNPTLLISAGNRADLLVRAPTAPGTYVLQSVQARSRCETLPTSLVPTIPTVPTPTPICAAPPGSPLLTVVVSGTPASGNEALFIPKDELQKVFPPFLSDIPDSAVKGTKLVVFESAPTGHAAGPGIQHTIDGQEFSGSIGEVVLLNTVEEWKIVNNTVNGAVQSGNVVATDPPGVVDHPFHIHINPFQIVEFFDPNEVLPPTPESQGLPRMKYIFEGTPGPGQCLLDINNPDSWKPCGPKPGAGRIWWDVFAIPSARAVFLPLKNGAAPTSSVTVPGYFKMRSRFADYDGQYVMHCHILAHEDRGMMSVVEVVSSNTPYTHH
jgi:FtsP/CotA-like multicopper oxidase with cupredoxin domain